MNTKSTTIYFNPEVGLYVAFLTDDPAISANGLTYDDACEQLSIVIGQKRCSEQTNKKEDA